MKTPNHTGIVALMINQGIIVIESSYIKGTSIKTPIGIFMQNIFSEKKTLQTIAMAILADIPRETTCIAALEYDGISLGLSIAGYSHRRFVPIQSADNGSIDGFKGKKPLENEKVVLITGTIGAGDHAGDAIRLIHKAGGECLGISCVFDFGLRPRYPLKTIYPLVTMAQLAEGYLGKYSENITHWLDQHKGLLRQEEKASLLV